MSDENIVTEEQAQKNDKVAVYRTIEEELGYDVEGIRYPKYERAILSSEMDDKEAIEMLEARNCFTLTLEAVDGSKTEHKRVTSFYDGIKLLFGVDEVEELTLSDLEELGYNIDSVEFPYFMRITYNNEDLVLAYHSRQEVFSNPNVARLLGYKSISVSGLYSVCDFGVTEFDYYCSQFPSMYKEDKEQKTISPYYKLEEINLDEWESIYSRKRIASV